jgi:hypothetical protein
MTDKIKTTAAIAALALTLATPALAQQRVTLQWQTANLTESK